MPQNMNRVVLTGNLTRDPELVERGGMQICNMRVACNTRRKNSSTGEWEDKPNYFDVVCFGAQGENCNRYLHKGSSMAVDGRLDWREWEKDGQKRQAVQIVADSVQFLDGASSDRSESSSSSASGSSTSAPPVSAAPSDDDIPF